MLPQHEPRNLQKIQNMISRENTCSLIGASPACEGGLVRRLTARHRLPVVILSDRTSQTTTEKRRGIRVMTCGAAAPSLQSSLMGYASRTNPPSPTTRKGKQQKKFLGSTSGDLEGATALSNCPAHDHLHPMNMHDELAGMYREHWTKRDC